MKVAEIMTGDVKSCRPESNLAEAARMMWENDCGCVPVVDDCGAVAGMITDRDICMAVATQNRLASEITAGEIASPRVVACTPDMAVTDALSVMQKEQVRRLPVIDDGGKLVGILSISDVTLNSKKGESKRDKHVAHKDVVATFKAISEPHAPAPAEDTLT